MFQGLQLFEYLLLYLVHLGAIRMHGDVDNDDATITMKHVVKAEIIENNEQHIRAE